MAPEQNLSLIKAVHILRQFTSFRPQLGVTEIAQLAQMPKSVVHRIVQTLESTGYLEQDPRTQKYRVGLLAYEIGLLYTQGSDLYQVVQEELRAFAEESTHTCYYGVRQERDVILLAVTHGSSPVRIAGVPGERLPAHCTALGKAMLAKAPSAELETYLNSPLATLTPRSVTDVATLRADLARTKANGYAISAEETYAGTCAIAFAIGDNLGAVSLSVPVFNFAPDRVDPLVALTRKYAERIARRVPGGFVR